LIKMEHRFLSADKLHDYLIPQLPWTILSSNTLLENRKRYCMLNILVYNSKNGMNGQIYYSTTILYTFYAKLHNRVVQHCSILKSIYCSRNRDNIFQTIWFTVSTFHFDNTMNSTSKTHFKIVQWQV
jgi:hypothetical protein